MLLLCRLATRGSVILVSLVRPIDRVFLSCNSIEWYFGSVVFNQQEVKVTEEGCPFTGLFC